MVRHTIHIIICTIRFTPRLNKYIYIKLWTRNMTRPVLFNLYHSMTSRPYYINFSDMYTLCLTSLWPSTRF